MKKVTLFAHNGQITAIAFPGEAMNFNGVPVHEVEAEDHDLLVAALHAVAPSGVGSPWPAIVPETPETPKAAKPAKVPKAAGAA